MCKHDIFWLKKIYYNVSESGGHKGGDSEINYIKRFQNAKVLAISTGNRYTENHLFQNFLEYFQQGGKYYDHIASHQEELRRKEKFIDQK